MLEHILQFYEDSLRPYLNQIISEQMQVQHDEHSTVLFQALGMFVNVLGKKGCVKAAFEYNKFLFKLNVDEDPAGALLSLDYAAVSSHDYQFVQRLIFYSPEQLHFPENTALLFFPNCLYSLALSCQMRKPSNSQEIKLPVGPFEFYSKKNTYE